MIDNIRTINNNLQWRVIGEWSATDARYNKPLNGSINYGFATKEKAIEYIDTLNHVANISQWQTERQPCTLSVKADKWSNMINLSGTYRVAQYINN